jgi:hypothetical protein
VPTPRSGRRYCWASGSVRGTSRSARRFGRKPAALGVATGGWGPGGNRSRDRQSARLDRNPAGGRAKPSR